LQKVKRIRKEPGSSIKEDEHITKGTWWVLLGGVFLISFSLLTFEITLTRLLSVMLSYHYVFLAVSLALLGLGVGGIFIHFFRPYIPSGHSRFGSLALLASLFALTIPLSVILVLQIGSIDTIGDNILPYCFLLFIPFVFAGMLLAEVFRMFSAISAWVYGADLVGAAGGSLAVVLTLDTLGGISTSFFLGVLASVAALLFAVKVLQRNIRVAVIAASSFLIVSVLLCTNLTGLYLPDIPIGANPAKQIHTAIYDPSLKGKIIETRWSAFGRTDLVEFSDYPEQMHIYVDGTAGTPMYRFSGDIDAPGSAVSNLKADFPGYFPFLFLEEEGKDNALVIGPGGGRDILLALMGGVRQVTAVEVNDDLVDIVVEYSWYNGGIYTDLDNVDIVIDEGRSFLKRQKDKYDIIMLSLPYTNSSRSLEGYALTENFLFTTNSISDYLDHLTDEGQLVVVCRDDVEISRLLSISLATLSESGVNNATAMEQLYIVGSERYPVFVLKKTPFEPTEASLRYESISQFGWYDPTSSYFPYIRQEGALNSVLMGLGSGEISLDYFVGVIKSLGYDISPVTDDSPFFYRFEDGLPRPVSLVFWPSIIMMMVVILIPLLFWRERFSPTEMLLKGKRSLNQNLIRSVVLFSMLGVGFMLVEISLIQRFVLFLGQPVLSMTALLFSLLVGAGMGSMCSSRLTSDKLIKGLTNASLFIVAILLVYTFLLPLIFEQLLGLGLVIRLLATVVILLPLGFAMGFPFPLGIRLLREMGIENYIPWMWGINGICSVLGSVMTIMIAISLGFTEALLIGASCYLLVFLVFRKRSIKKV
jgi:hypothetical protein